MSNSSFTTLLKGKERFLIKVYGILLFQLIITFSIIYSFREHPVLSKITHQTLLLYTLITIGILLIMILIKMPVWLKFLFFCLFTSSIAAMLHSISVYLPIETVNQALYGAISIFVVMTLVAIVISYQGINLSWMGIYLLGSLIALIIGSIMALFINPQSHGMLHKVLVILGLILFSIFIVYDTNVILQKNYNGDSIQASLDFYLSFINIFTRLLTLNVT